jgi:hypothetical protein
MMEQSQQPIEEIDFTCWWEGQNEGDGKDIKATNREEAARMAVDIWRHENLKELKGKSITVFLKDPEGIVSKVVVNNR